MTDYQTMTCCPACGARHADQCVCTPEQRQKGIENLEAQQAMRQPWGNVQEISYQELKTQTIMMIGWAMGAAHYDLKKTGMFDQFARLAIKLGVSWQYFYKTEAETNG